jgi:hypothetical protein
MILWRYPAAAGEGLVTITLNASGFDKGAVIKVNGTACLRQWVSPYGISATATVVAGTYTITATNPVITYRLQRPPQFTSGYSAARTSLSS